MKILKIIHLIFAVMWMGGVMVMNVLKLLISPQHPEMHDFFAIAEQAVDSIVIIPGAMGILLTGIVYGIWTNWGFFKQRWITVKWIITIWMTINGIFIIGAWDNEYIFLPLQLATHTFVLIISVLKPWKKKK